MATDAHRVAIEFLRLAEDRGVALTPLQLMKLVYIAHGWMLGLWQRPLITNRIEAWKYGPVIPDLYHTTKEFGSGFITGELPIRQNPRPPLLDDDEVNLIREVSEIYGKLSGIQLSAMTHKPGTPWAETYRSDVGHIPISNDVISEHYRNLSRERLPPHQ